MYMVIKMVVAMHVYVWCESVGHGGGTTERGKAEETDEDGLQSTDRRREDPLAFEKRKEEGQ